MNNSANYDCTTWIFNSHTEVLKKKSKLLVKQLRIIEAGLDTEFKRDIYYFGRRQYDKFKALHLFINSLNLETMKKKTTYKPLPDCLTINPSELDGLGLFAVDNIPKGTNLGISHIHLDNSGDIIRTPLGGWYNGCNEASEANCVKEQFVNEERTEFHLVTTKDVKEDEEIIVKYTFDEYQDVKY